MRDAGPPTLRLGLAGTGNLTRHLLAAGAVVTAVEKDEALAEALVAEFAQVGSQVPAWHASRTGRRTGRREGCVERGGQGRWDHIAAQPVCGVSGS